MVQIVLVTLTSVMGPYVTPGTGASGGMKKGRCNSLAQHMFFAEDAVDDVLLALFQQSVKKEKERNSSNSANSNSANKNSPGKNSPQKEQGKNNQDPDGFKQFRHAHRALVEKRWKALMQAIPDAECLGALIGGAQISGDGRAKGGSSVVQKAQKDMKKEKSREARLAAKDQTGGGKKK